MTNVAREMMMNTDGLMPPPAEAFDYRVTPDHPPPSYKACYQVFFATQKNRTEAYRAGRWATRGSVQATFSEINAKITGLYGRKNVTPAMVQSFETKIMKLEAELLRAGDLGKAQAVAEATSKLVDVLTSVNVNQKDAEKALQEYSHLSRDSSYSLSTQKTMEGVLEAAKIIGKVIVGILLVVLIIAAIAAAAEGNNNGHHHHGGCNSFFFFNSVSSPSPSYGASGPAERVEDTKAAEELELTGEKIIEALARPSTPRPC